MSRMHWLFSNSVDSQQIIRDTGIFLQWSVTVYSYREYNL